MSAAAAALLRARARYLRTVEGRRAAEWHQDDALMVAGELDRMARAVARLTTAQRRSERLN